MTALHLAAMTGNIRIVKKLLLRGANRHLKDIKGSTAADTAQESQYHNIYNLLQESNCLLEFLNIKSR
jgi:palmitoyltransferase